VGDHPAFSKFLYVSRAVVMPISFGRQYRG